MRAPGVSLGSSSAFDSLAAVLLIVLLIVVFTNYARGTLGDWFAAKFLGRSSAGSSSATKPAIPTTSNGAHVPPTHVVPSGGGGRF